MYRSVLANRRVLIVLDNANDAKQVRPLLPGAAGCVVLVTSRTNQAGLVIGEGAAKVTLDLLTEQESLELVRAIVGPRRADAEPEAVTALVRACARLPLALRIAAGRAVTNPYLTIAELVTELNSEQGRWAALSAPADEHTALRTVFDWSYHRLSGDQARMLRRLGLHPGPEISIHAAAAVAGLDVADTRLLLDALAAGHLIQPIARDRYRFHDLLRAYATDRANQDDAPADRDRARHTLMEWYAHHTRSAYRIIVHDWLADWHAGADLDTRAYPEITFTRRADAWAWVDVESVNTTAVVRAAASHGLPELTILLADISADACLVRGLWGDTFALCRLGLTAARRIGDRTAECYLLRGLGLAHQHLAQWREASENYTAALVRARELDNPALHAAMLSHLGEVCIEQERYAEAHDYLRTAQPISPGTQHGVMESHVEGLLSAACTGLGDHEAAFRHAERSLSLLRQSGHLDAEAYPLHAMARARQGAGAHSEAIALCEQAFKAHEPHDRDLRSRALFLDTLATSLHHTGATAQAMTCWREALAILDDLNDHRADNLRDRLRALESPKPGRT